jgi:anti-anti-sigma regulatory factor
MSVEGYELRRIGQHGVVTVPAEVDVTNTDEVRRATTFCDSTGVQAIIATYRQTAATGTELRLVATETLRILTVIGVDQLIPIYPDLNAALVART